MSFVDLALEALEVTFAEFGVVAIYSPSNGNSVNVRVIAKQPDEIVGFGDTRIHTETSVFEVRVSEMAGPRSGDVLTVDNVEYIIQGEPERRDAHRLVWTLDVRAA